MYVLSKDILFYFAVPDITLVRCWMERESKRERELDEEREEREGERGEVNDREGERKKGLEGGEGKRVGLRKK